jgi:hypothetical protein
MRNRGLVVAAHAAILLLSLSARAYAQDAQATGSVSTSTPPIVTSTGNGTVAAGGGQTIKVDDNSPDHDRFIGRFAVGYFGVSQLPTANPTLNGGGIGGLAAGTVSAPTIGVRYWLNRMWGIDGGLGLGLSGGSTEVVNGATTTSTDKASNFGAVLHGGVPVALAHGKHYTFLVIPEMNIGFTSGTIKQVNGPDVDLSGFRFDLGGRVGAEVHFGFIGIPELSLEGSVGLAFHRQAFKAKTTLANGTTSSASDGTTTFGTNVQSDPWALFVNNISAFYYF